MWRTVVAAATLLMGASGLSTQGQDTANSPARECPTRLSPPPSDCLTTCAVGTMDPTTCECDGDNLSRLVEEVGGTVDIFLSENEVDITAAEPGHGLKLRSLNPETGRWEEERTVTQSPIGKRRKRQQGFTWNGSILVTPLNYNVYQWVNAGQRCYTKVRVFQAKSVLNSETSQVNNVNVEFAVVNTALDQGNQRFARFYTARTSASDSGGACVEGWCRPSTVTYVSATEGATQYDAAWPAELGFIPPGGYTRGNGGKAFSMTLTRDGSAGPSYGSLSACRDAPFTNNHFKFYGNQVSGVVEHNTIPYDPFSNDLRPHYLSWYPSEDPNEKRSCYMKIKVTGTNHENLRALVVSSVGVHPANPGRDYGRREDDVGPAGAATKGACIEYKCSGDVWTTRNNRPWRDPSTDIDYTLLKLSFLRSDGTAASCSRVAIAPVFTAINQIISMSLLPYSVSPPNNDLDLSRFLFYDSPYDYGHSFGLYKAAGGGENGKQTAYERCLSGTSSGTGATTIDPDANWLVHFDCTGDHVSGLVEMNTVPYDPATNNLRPHYLSWYPSEQQSEKRSCFMKVRVTGTNHEDLRALVVSSVGVHSANPGRDYGRREDDVGPAGAATKGVCIEYKCSGDVWTTRNNRPYRDPSNDIDYTFVKLSFLRSDGSAASCSRVAITPVFSNIDQITLMTLQTTYSVSPPDNSDQSRFQFYDSPNDLGLSFGIYKATGANDAGKQAAYQRCLAGTSSGTGATTIDPDANWLVHFHCN